MDLTTKKKIRLASEKDSAQLLKIYGPFIENTSVSFEYQVPTEVEFAKRIKGVLENFPWLICELDGEIVGYAYASMHSERAAYQWSINTSIYVSQAFHRQHIATSLYTALIDLLRVQGFYNAYAGVTMPNVSSENFHESFGFKPLGAFHHVGYKFEKWLDVKWFEFTLSELPQKPAIPKSIDEIKDTKEFKKIIQNATLMIK